MLPKIVTIWRRAVIAVVSRMNQPKVDDRTYRTVHKGSRGIYGAQPRCIMLHDTDAPSGDSRRYLVKNDRGASIHDLIWYDGTIYNYASPDVATWHAGVETTITIDGMTYRNNAVNLVSYGIELERKSGPSPFYPDDQLLSLGWRINDLRARFGNIPIFRHGDADVAVPKRRWDPRQLTIAVVEGWCLRAKGLPIMPTSMAERWGTIPVNWDYAIPVAWLKRPEKYGKALTRETYVTPLDGNGVTSIQLFEHGFIVYNKTVNKAFGRLYSEM